MKNRTLKCLSLLFMVAAILTLGACKKKVAPTPPPPPPAPTPAPTASLSASPDTINPGQSATLSWQTTNADSVMIDGIGKVDASGQRNVTPAQSTTYHLTATGKGGTQEATARVTVTTPPAVTAPPPSASEEQQFTENIKDIFFDYDKYDLRPDQTATVQADAQWLAQHPNIRFTVEGHCDERGSTEYNIALGDNRAQAVKNALTQAGVPADRVKTISYGKEKPVCTESNEQCWQQNRRAHFVYGQK